MPKQREDTAILLPPTDGAMRLKGSGETTCRHGGIS